MPCACVEALGHTPETGDHHESDAADAPPHVTASGFEMPCSNPRHATAITGAMTLHPQFTTLRTVLRLSSPVVPERPYQMPAPCRGSGRSLRKGREDTDEDESQHQLQGDANPIDLVGAVKSERGGGGHSEGAASRQMRFSRFSLLDPAALDVHRDERENGGNRNSVK